MAGDVRPNALDKIEITTLQDNYIDLTAMDNSEIITGIVNTAYHAREVTGVDAVYAVIGGFHLSGPLFEPIIEITASAMEEVAPSYIAPAHCTGRKAIGYMETLMPSQFIMNMSGTKLTFSS